MSPASSEEALIVHRHIAASPTRVFAAWTDPDRLLQWWGPQGVECTHAEVDLVVDGTFRLANELPNGDSVWISGRYTVIDPPHRLEHTWVVGPPDPDSTPEHVAIDFTPSGSGTDVTITHSRIASAEARSGHEVGWIGCLEGLARIVV